MKKTLFALIGFILIVSMFLAACSTGTSTSKSTATTNPATTTPTATVDKYGGVWREGEAAAPSKGIGYVPEFNNDSYIWASPALETLMQVQQDGTITPNLATAWKVADDGLSVTLTLRQGVKFHDGSDFNADVCKWNLDGEIAAKAANAMSWKSVDVIDPYTVRINLTSFQNIILNNLTTWVSMQASKAYVDKNGIEAARWNPVGTGAFIFDSYVPGSKATYKRNPNYWDTGKPYVDGVTFSVIADDTVRKLAFEKGDLDRVTVAGGSDATEVQNLGFPIKTAPGGTFFLVPDSNNPNSPWANIKVRQAGYFALDRASLAKGLGLGYLNPAFQLYPGYADSKIPDLPLKDNDPVKAKQLLSEAGYPTGFKTNIHNATRGTPKDYMEAVAQQLRGIGLEITTDMPDAGRYSDMRAKGWNDGLLNHGTAAAGNKNSLFQSTFMGKDFVSCKIPDAFITAATASINSKNYDPKLVQAAFKILSDDVTVIPYAEQVQCCFYRKGTNDPDAALFGTLLPHWKNLWIDKSAR
ncbi:MAG TPA: ABC transporter substrate-binding protein [Dehalococcoidales bacterium]|nr:ABC transporter substrate-binding protein [Dehalococcoidales bacterium]